MKRYISALIFCMASKWFYFVSFPVGGYAILRMACKHSECNRDIVSGDQPSDLFEIMVRVPSKNNEVTPVLLADLQAFLNKHLDATFIMLESQGSSEGWSYEVAAGDDGRQLISATKTEGNKVSVKYIATEERFEPLSSTTISPGHLFSAMTLGLFFAWLTHIVFSILYKKLRPTS